MTTVIPAWCCAFKDDLTRFAAASVLYNAVMVDTKLIATGKIGRASCTIITTVVFSWLESKSSSPESLPGPSYTMMQCLAITQYAILLCENISPHLTATVRVRYPPARTPNRAGLSCMVGLIKRTSLDMLRTATRNTEIAGRTSHNSPQL